MIKARFDRYLGMTVLAYILLIVGCFLPVIILSGIEDLWISLTYNSVGGGMGDGFLIIGMLVLSLPIVILAKYRWLIIPAILISGIVTIDFLDIQGNFLFGDFIFMPTWIALFLGSFALIAVSVMDFMRKRSGKAKDQPIIEAAA